MQLVSLYGKILANHHRQKGINILNSKLKITIQDELIDAGFKDNTFNINVMYEQYQRLLKQVGDERTAANILVQAIRQAGLEGTSSKARHTDEIKYLVDGFILREVKTTADVKAIVEKRNKKSVRKDNAKESVPDWDHQEILEVSQDRLDAHQARIPWFKDREKYQGDKDAYKKISKFDDWKALQTKKELSAGTDNSTHANGKHIL